MANKTLSQPDTIDKTIRVERAKALTVLLHKRCDPEGRTLRVLTIMLMLASFVGVVSVSLIEAELVEQTEEVDFSI